jgi:hypothetical protein
VALKDPGIWAAERVPELRILVRLTRCEETPKYRPLAVCQRSRFFPPHLKEGVAAESNQRRGHVREG